MVGAYWRWRMRRRRKESKDDEVEGRVRETCVIETMKVVEKALW